MAGTSKEEVENSPFVERLLKKGFEVLYLTEAVDEYAISALPEFEGKKFQNVAKEGFSIDGDSDAAKGRSLMLLFDLPRFGSFNHLNGAVVPRLLILLWGRSKMTHCLTRDRPIPRFLKLCSHLVYLRKSHFQHFFNFS